MRKFIAGLFLCALVTPALAQGKNAPVAKRVDPPKQASEAAQVLAQWQRKVKQLRTVQTQQGKGPRTPDEELRMRGLLLRRLNPFGE